MRWSELTAGLWYLSILSRSRVDVDTKTSAGVRDSGGSKGPELSGRLSRYRLWTAVFSQMDICEERGTGMNNLILPRTLYQDLDSDL